MLCSEIYDMVNEILFITHGLFSINSYIAIYAEIRNKITKRIPIAISIQTLKKLPFPILVSIFLDPGS